MLKKWSIPHISFGASSVAFNDRRKYPYFLRTNPSDDLQMHFMVELLLKINRTPGSSVQAVNVLYTDGLYGHTAAEVCVQY